MEMAAMSSPTVDETEPASGSRGPTTPTTRDDVGDLTARLMDLERDLRHVWAALVNRDAGMAGRVGHASRLIHRAASVLETDLIY
jgi:hypothetical protein